MTTDSKASSSATTASSSSTENNGTLQQYISAKEVAQHQVFRGHDMRRSISSTQFNGGRESTSSPATNAPKMAAMGTSMSASNSPRCSSPASSPMAESILKVVLIGDSGVGKSNLVMRFTKNKYMPQSVQTVGFEFATKTIRVGDRRLKAQIWDTAGQERFQSLTAAYYRNAVGAMIVYDITNRSSFEHVTGWLAQVHEHSHESLVLILVGNKCDLAHLPESREVSTLEAARFAAKHSMEFLETSALDSTNVMDAFKKLIVPVGRLLSPTEPKKIARLPPGWRRVLSRTRPGEYSYENQYTKERISFAPKEPAKPSQQSFRAPATGMKSGVPSVVTVTRESLQKQHQKAYLAQNQTPRCGVCISDCTIL
ncbi:Rab11 family GTPase [Phytophthora megakarya]|uniref:Rab11 family GTPase n=1 Tax=Phytophthora megakarya TaxID=4795 RepID=A0A225WRW4_9STRA|nr:Rab11 family GTPase [Phytophthora megakarya]